MDAGNCKEVVVVPTTQEIIPTTQEVTPTTQIITEAPATTPETEKIEECVNKKCLKCSVESNKFELCLSCDITKYKVVNFTDIYPQYVNCLEEKKVQTKYYYDNEVNQYRPCYSTCKTCSWHGNLTVQNCIECDSNYMIRPGYNPYNNCVVYSEYYYLSPYNEYKPLSNPQCPEEAKYKVIDDNNKTSCIFDCKAHSTNNLLYQGLCWKECPNGTTSNNFICRENDPNKIYISKDEIYMDTNDTIKVIETLAITYSKEFNYTDNHISYYSNENLTVVLYKKPDIISNSGLKIPDIDFGDCYENVKKAYNITGNLLVAIADKKVKNNPSTFYLFFHPITGIKLEVEEICKNDTIQIKENLLSMLDETSESYELQTYLTQQGINIFDINDPYYKDICYDFDNPKKRDMALKDRIKETYVNVSLCDDGCINTGIDLQNNVATCNCKFNDITDNDLIHENAALEYLVGEFFELINSSNIMVLKCYKYILKYFYRSKGGIIIISLFILYIIFTIIFFIFELTKMKRYIFTLAENYASFLVNFPHLSKFFPPIKRGKKNYTVKIKLPKNDDFKDSTKKNNFNNTRHSMQRSLISQSHIKMNNSSKDLIISYDKRSSKQNLVMKEKIIKEKNDNLEKGKKAKKFFKDYLSTSPDDMEYDDAIKKDKRSFCKYFSDNLKDNQNIAYTFIADDPINTRMIKFILFCLNLDLYFVVIGLFYSESYISELYHLGEEDESFFSFIPRAIDKIIYTTLVSVAIGYMTEFFFLNENKIKGIFKREKNNKVILKRSIALLIKEIQNRYISFIIMTFVVFVVSLYYILCFNYVYPKTQEEWIKSSVLIIIIMQILSILKCLFESILRFLSFKFESVNLFKVSKFFNGNS